MLLNYNISLKKQLIKKLDSKLFYSPLFYGNCALQCLTSFRITSKQISECIQILKQKIQSIGKFWIRIYPDLVLTRSFSEKKSNIKISKHLYFQTYPFLILLEIFESPLNISKSILSKLQHVLPGKTKLIYIKKV